MMNQESLRLLDDLNKGDRIEVCYGNKQVAVGQYRGTLRFKTFQHGVQYGLSMGLGLCPITSFIRSIKRLSGARKP